MWADPDDYPGDDPEDFIYVWPDGTWCRGEDLEEYLSFMSDDFEVRLVLAYDKNGNPIHSKRTKRCASSRLT